jgi:hypothetical protein
MGIRIDLLTSDLIKLMDPEDQRRYGAFSTPGDTVVRPPADGLRRGAKTHKLEREEQAHFANWLLLQRSKGRKIPFCWHATNARSKATPGTPDFGVGCFRSWVWLEFKRDASCELSDEQEEFKRDCEFRNIPYFIVFNSMEAIKLVEEFDQLL